MRRFLLALPLLFGLTACDQIQRQVLGEDPAARTARQEAEGKAVGGACRHSGRAIEDCYAIYHWLQKAAIFAGWQEMDTYMRTNNIQTVEPQLPPPPPPGTKKKPAAEESADKPAAKNGAKTDKPEKNEKAETSDKEAKPAAK